MPGHGHRKKADQNQKIIVEYLRACGVSVEIISGTIDLLLGYGGRTYVVDIKNPEGDPRLRESQRRFMQRWRGSPLLLFYSVDDARAWIQGKHR